MSVAAFVFRCGHCGKESGFDPRVLGEAAAERLASPEQKALRGRQIAEMVLRQYLGGSPALKLALLRVRHQSDKAAAELGGRVMSALIEPGTVA